MRPLLERRASSFLFAASGLCAISSVSPAHAQVSDLGAVDILGRTFNCPSQSCDGLVQEATPGAYASNRDVGFSTKLGTDIYGQETYLWIFGDTPVYKRPSASSAYEPLSGGLFSTNSAGLTFYNPWTSQPSAKVQKTRTSMTLRGTGSNYGWSELIPRPEIGPGDSESCDGYLAAWPSSVVTLPNERDATLRDDASKPATAVVLAFFQDVCVQADQSVTRFGTGMAVFRWSSVATDDPHQQFTVPQDNLAYRNGLVAEVLTRTPGADSRDLKARALFENPVNDSGFQYGATVDDLGPLGKWLRVLRCHDKDFWKPDAQPKVGCELAQVQITGSWPDDRTRILNVDSWSYLRDPYATSDGWAKFTRSPDGAAASPGNAYDLTRSGGLLPGGYPENSPSGHTSLLYYAPRKLWVMLSMVWGYTDQAVVYTSASLTGPWSTPRPITLPASCNAATSQGCYAPSLHAELGDASSLGLTFVDRDGLTVAGGQKVQLMRYGALASSALPAP